MKLDEIAIPAPCTLDWRKMTPAEGGRFCGDCKKVVKDLSSMTEREARAVMRSEGGGELCVRFVYDAQGRVFFGKDAPKRDALLPAGMLSRAKRLAVAAGLAVAAQACNSPLGADDGELMGAVRMPEQPRPPLLADDAGAPQPTTQPTQPSALVIDAGFGADASVEADAGADAAPEADAAVILR